jgi:hypothetical protein
MKQRCSDNGIDKDPQSLSNENTFPIYQIYKLKLE